MSERYGKRQGPRRVLLYGIHGFGKSTWANQPGVKFFDVEDGLGDIDLYLEPYRVKQYGDIIAGISWVAANPEGIKAVAIDTVDALERFVWAKVAEENKKPRIEDVAYGKGYEVAVTKWMEICKGLSWLRENHGMTIILIGHCKMVKVKPPGSDSYDQYQPDLHATASSYLSEWATEVLFCNYRTFTRTEDMGFNKTRTIAVGGTDRYLMTTRTATADAKNRLNLPAELNFDFWGTDQFPGFGRFLPKPSAQSAVSPAVATSVADLPPGEPTVTPISMEDVFSGVNGHSNIDGLVVDGSSKVPV